MSNSILKNIKNKGYIRILEAHSGLSSKIAAEAGFDGIWVSSLTDSAVRGLPDTELVTLPQRAEKVKEIRRVCSLPIVVDVDTGGQIDHFPWHAKELEAAGADALVIEDKAFPKKNSLDRSANHRLEEIDKFCEKIKAGKEAVSQALIIARLESLIAKRSMFEALVRAEAFMSAGADGVVIHSKEKVGDQEVIAFARKFKPQFPKAILMCIPTAYNHVYDEKLAREGFSIICHANQLLRASVASMAKIAKTIKEKGRGWEAEKEIASVEEIFRLTGYRK